VVYSSRGLRIVNVTTDPTIPTEVGYLEQKASGVAVSGNNAYIAASDEGLRIIDISSPSSPSEAGFFDGFDGAQNMTLGPYGYLYVASDTDGLDIFDVSTPSAPTVVGSCDTPGEAYGVAVFGNHAFIADNQEGLRAIDITDPAQPYIVGFYDVAGESQEVSVDSAGYIYLPTRSGGVLTLEFKPLIYLPLIGR